jgi:hypothetical protein
MTELAGHAEILRIGKLRTGQYVVQYFKRSALMRQDCRAPVITEAPPPSP